MTLFDFQRQFPDDATCIAFLEKQRWGENGEKRFCPHCGATRTYKYASGKLYKCGECRKQFTATVGTIFEGSHIPLQKWFYAAFLNTSLKKGISSIQLAKYLGITQKSAWFMLQRIRYGLEVSGGKNLLGTTNPVEIDETYIGGVQKGKNITVQDKAAVFGAVERNGNVKLKHVKSTGSRVLLPEIAKSVQHGATIYSDQWQAYRTLDRIGYVHDSVNHSISEFGRGIVNTNTIEGTWAHLKLSLKAIYMGVSKKHLQLYCSEYAFRFNRRDMDDGARFTDWFDYCNGRLTYKTLTAGE